MSLCLYTEILKQRYFNISKYLLLPGDRVPEHEDNLLCDFLITHLGSEDPGDTVS